MDPYRPPATELTEPPAPRPPRFRVLPVRVGGLGVDFIGSLIAGVLGTSVVAASTIASGGGPDQVARDVASSKLLLWLGSAIGFGLTLLVLHGAAAGSISLWLASPSNLPPWLFCGGWAAQVPLAAAGGWLAGCRAR
jgi:hypothetical protein